MYHDYCRFVSRYIVYHDILMNNWHSEHISQTHRVIQRALKQTGEVHAYMVFQLLLWVFKKKDQLVSMLRSEPITLVSDHIPCRAE